MSTHEAHAPASSNSWLAPLLQYIVALLVALLVLVPLLLTALNGFKANAELMQRPFALPDVWIWTNYTSVL